jgi:Secretion system C-terminal sorting domain
MYSQVRFKITRQADRVTYIVSMISEKTFEGNQNITGTAQVTLKIEAASNFVVREIASLRPETRWVNNAMISKHELAPNSTYLSFGMETMGHNQFKYKEGEETLLFSFKNVGDTKANVTLLDNERDILAKSTLTTKRNIKNYISILGHGPGNAYIGNVETPPISQEDAMKINVQIQNLYPNPASDRVTISWENQLDDFELIKTFSLLITDVTGLEKMRIFVNPNFGKQSQDVDVNSFISGTYFLKLQRDEKYDSNVHKLMVIK